MARPTKLDRLKRSLAINEVSLFVPPFSVQEIARDRTEGMVDHFLVAVEGMNFIAARDGIALLARSAYLQGVNDAAAAMVITKVG